MLKHLKLENYRNHQQLEIELSEITVLIGRNGAGKSNILEAIAMLSFCRSFRDDAKKNVVFFEADYARIRSGELEVFIQKNPVFLLKPKSKGVARKQSEFIGQLRCVIFSPESLELVSGSPKQRRRFLDIMISQRNPEYLNALIAYEKVRSERNSLLLMILQHRASEPELDFWDNEIAKYGQIIIGERQKAIGLVNELISTIYGKISGSPNDHLRIEYESNAIGEDYLGGLAATRRREIAAARTVFGPHRDDFRFILNNHDMGNFASRGETKSAVLALKMAELAFLTNSSKEKPILLLDDVFSEFDQYRRKQLIEVVQGYQTVISTTDRSNLSEQLLSHAKIIQLAQCNSQNF
ncbi:MAG: DNA replication/repair protein RecF [Patescibacteria group bacterium]